MNKDEIEIKTTDSTTKIKKPKYGVVELKIVNGIIKGVKVQENFKLDELKVK